MYKSSVTLKKLVLTHGSRYGTIVLWGDVGLAIDEARKLILEHKHYGDWISKNEIPKGVTYANDE